jgi:hypothetical protein
MAADRVVRNAHRAIIADAEAKLKRPLRDHERRFIVSRESLVALEMIHDTVRSADLRALEAYLGSER